MSFIEILIFLAICLAITIIPRAIYWTYIYFTSPVNKPEPRRLRKIHAYINDTLVYNQLLRLGFTPSKHLKFLGTHYETLREWYYEDLKFCVLLSTKLINTETPKEIEMVISCTSINLYSRFKIDHLCTLSNVLLRINEDVEHLLKMHGKCLDKS